MPIKREGCGGHEVALPFDAFEKSIKRIAEANSKARNTPTRCEARGTPKKHYNSKKSNSNACKVLQINHKILFFLICSVP